MTNDTLPWWHGLALWRGAGALGFLVIWTLIALLVDSALVPRPMQVAASLAHHSTHGDLWYHTGITLLRVAAAFAISLPLGTAIGMLMGRSRRANALLEDLLILGLNVPALVVIVLCYIWFGLTETAAILAVSVNKIPLVAATMREGARAVDNKLIDVGIVYRLTPYQRWRAILMPQLYPYAMAATRTGLSLIWKVVLVVELLGRSNGVGFQLHVFFQFFDIESILAYTVAFVAIILALEMIVLRPLEQHLNRWRS